MEIKRILSLVLAIVLCIGLCACGVSKPAEEPAKPAETEAPKVEAPEAEVEETEAPAAITWPSDKTVYVDVPARAGGGTDMMLRFATAGLEQILDGVSFVVTNYDTPEVGAIHAKDAAPDGLNLTVASGSNISNWLSGASNVNPQEDLTIIAMIHSGGPQAWIGTADAPYKTFPELVDYIKAHPGELTIGCGLGSTSQMVWIATFNAIDPALNDMVNYVQAVSEMDKLTGVASGALDLANCSINNAMSYEADGRITVLGTLGPAQADLAAISGLVGAELSESYKSMKEQGIDFAWESGFYICGPADMDPALVEAINAVIMGLAEPGPFMDGMNKMAVFTDVRNVADSQAAFDAEWQVNADLLTSLGMNARG